MGGVGIDAGENGRKRTGGLERFKESSSSWREAAVSLDYPGTITLNSLGLLRPTTCKDSQDLESL